MIHFSSAPSRNSPVCYVWYTHNILIRWEVQLRDLISAALFFIGNVAGKNMHGPVLAHDDMSGLVINI